MTEEQFKQQLLDELAGALHAQPEALRFLVAYFRYAHFIDDLIDEPKNDETTREAFALGEAMFASEFWRQYGSYLYPVLRVVHFEYFVSVDWEKSEDEWKRRHADVIRHAGNSVAVAVLTLFCQDDEVMRVSKRLKEFSHTYHHDYQGEDDAAINPQWAKAQYGIDFGTTVPVHVGPPPHPAPMETSS